MKTIALGVFVVLVASVFAEAGSKIVGGDFETVSADRLWNIPKAWSAVSGAGRKGSRAIVWDNADPKHYAFPFQRFAAEPGSRFRFSGWVRAERGELGELEPQISIDWTDAQDKWLGEARARRVVDNDPNTRGWSRYEGVVTFPAGAAMAKFLIYMPRGKTGRVLFDDMTLEQVSDEPLVYLQCGAYRNAFTAADGDIRFAAMLRLNVIRNRLSDYACEVSFKDASGATAVRPVTDFDAERAIFSIPAAEFALGRQEVSFRISLKGKPVAETKRAVTRTADPIRRRISIDRCRRVVIDGRRFFPLGLYTHRRMTAEDFEVWAEAPLNFTVMYGELDRATVDRFAKTGTYVCADVRSLIYGYNYFSVSAFKNFSESRVAFEKKVSELATRPNFFGWYLIDEVPLDQAPFVTAANELLQEIDPDHPTYAVTDKPHHVRELLPTYDAVGMDPYPIGGWSRHLTIASGWAERCREAMFDFRPMWHVPQMFNWYWVRDPAVVDYKTTANLPTRREMANMAWQGIAAGANGICGYGFHEIRNARRCGKAERDKFWPDVCRVMREIKSMEDVLLADDIALPVANLPKTLVARAYRFEGADYLLIANRTFDNVAATLDLPKGAYSSLEMKCGEGVYLDGDRLKVILDGLGYAFMRLNGQFTRQKN